MNSISNGSATRGRRMALAMAVLAAMLVTPGCGGYMKLDGAIERVRVVETGGTKSLLVVEFQVTNGASIAYAVRDAEIEVSSGSESTTGDTVAARDIQNICQHVAALSGDCSQPLVTRESIAPGATVKRLVAASFDLTADQLRARKGLLLRIREVDRMETELRETK